MNKEQYKSIINELCDENCSCENECVLKLFVESQHTSLRLLMQMRCVQKYKIMCEKLDNRKYNWTEIMELWISNKRAERFAKVFSEDKKYLEIYREVMEKENEE